MDEYLILSAPAVGYWVVNGSGQWVNVFQGNTTTLRADYVTALGAQIQIVGGGSETPLAVKSQSGLDLDLESTWTDAVADGFVLANDGDVELVGFFDGTGGGTREITVEGSPDLVLSLSPGQERRSGRLTQARFGTLVLVHFDDHTGVSVVAIDKGGV